MHVDNRVSPEWRHSCGTSDDDLLDALDALEAEARPWGYRWLERFEFRHDPPERALQLLSRWLVRREARKSFEIVADCVAMKGCRHDLGLLEGEDGDDLTAIRLDTRFAVWHRTLS